MRYGGTGSRQFGRSVGSLTGGDPIGSVFRRGGRCGCLTERGNRVLPFGYFLERNTDLLILRRPDGSFVAAYSAVSADLFEVELTVWEDAD